MKAPGRKVGAKTVERLLFARLLVPTKRALSREQVVKSVAQALGPLRSSSNAEAAVKQALDDCERRGLIASVAESRPGSRSKARSKPGQRGVHPNLTAKGRALAATLFGRSVPALKSWEHGKQVVGLSLIGRAAAAQKVLRVDDLAALILGNHEVVPSSIDSLSAVVDYLAWRALGVETSAAFDVQAVQRHLLRRLVPADVRVDPTIWRRMLAMRSIGARSHDANALIQALLAEDSVSREAAKPKRAAERSKGAAQRRKLTAAKPSSEGTAARSAPSSPANDNSPHRTAQPTLAAFAAAVRQAAGLPAVARFHDDRAFIGSVWEQMRDRGLLSDMTLPEFKARLIAAHRDGLLRITRADLVSAMDPDEVERSEARYQDATFHFVALEARSGR